MAVDTKVVIIGAGPAGLSAANELGSKGIDYLLFAKEKEPCVEKVCGGFIPTRALGEFKLGTINGAHNIFTVRMKFPGMELVRVDFEKPVGINATRGNLGRAMLGLIPNHREHVRMESTINTVKEHKEHVEILYTEDNERKKLTTEIVIDASGANPVSIRNGLVRDRISNEQMGYGIQYHLELGEGAKSFEPVNDFYYGSEYSPGGYAWLFPRSRVAVVGTGGIVNRVKTTERSVTEYLDHFILGVEPIRTDLSDATIVKKEAAPMPLAGQVKPSFSDRILLAGDAAGQCSPISGEGIYYSMIGGSLAGRTAPEVLDRKDVSQRTLSKYEKRWIGAMGSDLKWGAWLQKRFTSSGSSSLASNFLKSDKNQRVIAEMLVGERSVRSAITKAAPGYLRSKIGI
ncbi:MAG: NAD(P)/FAD-dependent oxidoreductase [Candidatus Thorarchaeota archaeon]|nr:NAD(P)/FAD-dependent oxidoreductase [Candidatus Thorarchaeota archaeon]